MRGTMADHPRGDADERPDGTDQRPRAADVAYAHVRDPPGDEKDLTLLVFEFDDIGRFAIPSEGEQWSYTGDCGPCYPIIPSAVGPVYVPRNQDGNPPNSNGDGLAGACWEPRQEHRAREHFAAVYDRRQHARNGWSGWVWCRKWPAPEL